MTLARNIAGSMAVGVIRRVIGGAMVGLDVCEEEGRPLTQLQRIDVLTSLCQGLDGLTEEMAADLTIDAHLSNLRDAMEGKET